MSKIKDFWEFNNDSCWKIKRKGMVDFYLYIPTMKYIYKVPTAHGGWRGTKNPHPTAWLNEKECLTTWEYMVELTFVD